jgi:tripartite ATP-independent transporter DctP family solute receptor
MNLKSKKLIAGLLLTSFTLATALTGCGGGNSNQQSSNTSAQGESAEPITFTVANVMATGNNVTLGVEKFAELVEEKSGGAMIVDVHSDAELGSDVDTTQQVQAGSMDMATCSTDNFGVFDPDVTALCLPYIVSSDKIDALYDAIDNGDLGNYYRERMAAMNLHPLMFNEYGFRSFHSASKPIVSPADMKDMKLRATSSQVELAVAEALGAPAQTVAWGETYTALQQKTVDGESNTFGLLHAAKHDEVLKYSATTEHNYSMHILLMAEDKYQALTDEQKAILDEAAAEAVAYERELSVQAEQDAKDAFKAQGVEITELTDEQKAEWVAATAGVYDKLVPSVISQEVVDMIKATQE